MRRVLPVLLAATVLGMAFRPATALAVPAHEVKPLVLLLLDTSGSMEYDAVSPGVETGDEDNLAPPVCNGVGDSGKSRYIVALEVLTGTFDGYNCTVEDRSNALVAPCPREDCPYVVPHIVPHGTQAADGLIDRSIESFKFGIMTFDTKANPSPVEAGGYSYGPETGAPNYGARNEDAPTGGFVHPTTSDDPDDIRLRNQEVQQSILSAIPFGGTPISPLLYDALHYFQSDEVLLDPYTACRPKSVVLITDGRANLGEGESPYRDSVAQAQALRDAGINVYVIGFKLAPNVASIAENIATNNHTLDAPFFRADNSVDLVRAFTEILGNLSVATQSRTRTVVTNETGNTVDVQYQFNAAHAKVPNGNGVGDVPGLRQGLLERSVYQCGLDENNPGQATLASVQRLSDLLNERTDERGIYTALAGALVPFKTDSADLTAQILGVPTGGASIPDFSRDPSTGLCRTGFLTGDTRVEDFRTNLIEYVRAEDTSCRHVEGSSGNPTVTYRTGAFDHGTPVIQGRLTDVDLPIPSFTLYKQSIADRPVMLYIPSHDALLHAFRVDRTNGTIVDPSWGREEWAFIPPHTLSRLPLLPQGQRTLLDGSPVVRDVLFSRSSGSLANEAASAWHSVLVVGDRDGGRGLTALDVTDPTPSNWKFLWDISAEGGRCLHDSADCNPGGAALFANDYSSLGKTWGKPEVGTVQVCPDNAATCDTEQVEEVAVAVLPGGSGRDLPAGAGRTVVVIRLDTGEKLAEFKSGNSNVDNSCTGAGNLIDADMVGNVACYSTFQGTFMSRCFMGDAAGRLWRLEIGSIGVPDWNLTLFYDPYASITPVPALDSAIRSPVYEAPSIAVAGRKNQLVVLYGSGEMDSLDCTTEQALRRDFVVSLLESVEDYPLAIEPLRTCSPWNDSACRKIFAAKARQIGPSVIWKKFLGYTSSLILESGAKPCERMMGPPVIFSSVAYFTTFTPDLDVPCSPGIGKLYGTAFDRHDETANCATLLPRLPDPNDPTGYVLSERIGTATTGAIPYGLTIVTRPACSAGSSISGSSSGATGFTPFGSSGAPSPQIVVQTGVFSEEMTAPAGGVTQRKINEASRTIRRAVESIFVSAWGNLLD